MFEAVILIGLQVLMTSIMWYFISLMIKEDIPCLKSAYLLQIIVQTLNETAIYHSENPCSTWEGAKHVLVNIQHSSKNQRTMHGNYENILFWRQFKFRITFQLQFL